MVKLGPSVNFTETPVPEIVVVTEAVGVADFVGVSKLKDIGVPVMVDDGVVPVVDGSAGVVAGLMVLVRIDAAIGVEADGGVVESSIEILLGVADPLIFVVDVIVVEIVDTKLSADPDADGAFGVVRVVDNVVGTEGIPEPDTVVADGKGSDTGGSRCICLKHC